MRARSACKTDSRQTALERFILDIEKAEFISCLKDFSVGEKAD